MRNLLRRTPVSIRIAALTAASVLALLTVVGVVVYLQLGAILRAGIDQQLAATAASLPVSVSPGALERADDEPGLDLDIPDTAIQVVGPDGTVIGDDGDVRRSLLGDADLATARGGEPVLRTVNVDDEDVRALAVPRGSDGTVVVVAAELEEVEDAQGALLTLYAPVAVLAAVLAAGLGYLVARRALAPVARMTEEARSIGAAEPSRRLSVPDREDELTRLGRTLNEMLSRLDAALARERTFTADASHELRTPLAILRAEVDLAREHVHADVRTSLDSVVEEVQRLEALVDDLLLLARADAHHLTRREPVDLDDLVAGVLFRFARPAAARRVRLACSGAAVVHADPRALDRAVANLVDNALRHSPDGGAVSVVVSTREGGAQLRVQDDGPGVPPERLPALFDRFTTGDETRRDGGGAGLGLAIVAAVVHGHGGTVTATNRREGGLGVVLDLPD